jgi:hypothetical protein
MRWLGLGIVAAGCNNPCQDLCKRMADYATECELPVTDAEIDECIARQADGEREELDVCREHGDAEVIRAQWTCEDLAVYWQADEETAEER